IPSEEDEAWEAAGLGIAIDVMIAVHAFRLTEDRVVRLPGVPDELGERDGHGDQDAGDRTQEDDPEESGKREPELPALDPVQAPQAADLEEPDRRSNHDRGERGLGQVVK